MQGIAESSIGGMHDLEEEDAICRRKTEEDLRNVVEQEMNVNADSVEIACLSDEKSQEAARLLYERHIANLPLRSLLKNIQCNEENEEDTTSRTAKVEDDGPYIRLARNIFPAMGWIPNMKPQQLKADIIAGLTVGVMVIPQGMSYASIAGLEYKYGLYSACIPTFVYAFFGQSRQLAVGPVAMVSLLVEAGLRGQLRNAPESEGGCDTWYGQSAAWQEEHPQSEICPTAYAEMAILVSFTVGVLNIASSILRLGFIVSFLGHPVTSGFTSGAAIIIGLSQVKYVLGYNIPKSQYVHETLYNIATQLGETNAMSLVLGIIWIVYLMANKKICAKPFMKKFKLMGAMGPLISCVIGIVLLYFCEPLRASTISCDERRRLGASEGGDSSCGGFGVQIVGEIPSGLSPLSFHAWRFGDIGAVLPTAITSCVIGYMESIAIGKSLASKHGYEIEAGQELLALGFANLVGSMFSAYPVTGSFSRSAVNNTTGAVSQFSGIVTAVFLFIVLLCLTWCFEYLPKFALSAIVISSVASLIAYNEAIWLWKVKKQDCLLWFVAFFGTLFLGVLLGILVAVTLSLVIVIYESVRPQITILWRIPGTTIYRNVKQDATGAFIPNVFICRIGSSMYFANASFVKDMILTYVADLEEANPTKYVIFEMTPVVSVDSTAVHVIQDLVHDFRARGLNTAFCMVGNRVDKTLRAAGLKDEIGGNWFFPNVNEAVHYCLRHQQQISERSSVMKNEPTHKHVVDNTAKVRMGNEIGFSNEINANATCIFIYIMKDSPGVANEITALFKKFQIVVIRAQIEPNDEGGAKHTYFVKSQNSNSKLSNKEGEKLLDALKPVVDGDTMSPSAVTIGNVDGTDISGRMGQLEALLTSERADRAALQEQLKSQSEKMDRVLAALELGTL